MSVVFLYSAVSFCVRTCCGSVTMTTESYKNGAITLSRINFSGYVGVHVTIFI